MLGPTLLIAVGIGLTFATLMAAATADVPERDAGDHLAFLMAAGLSLAIAAASVLLPRHRLTASDGEPQC